MRCGEGAGSLKGCGRNRTMLSLTGRSRLPVPSPTAGLAMCRVAASAIISSKI